MDEIECPRCQKRGQAWEGDLPHCGFPNAAFDSDNWNCATLNALREHAEAIQPVWTEDQYAALLPFGGSFIVLGWYKHRGRTEYAGLLDEDVCRPLRLDEAEHYLARTHRSTSRQRNRMLERRALTGLLWILAALIGWVAAKYGMGQ